VHLVLCSENDRPALWAYQKLREAGLAPIELVTASSLDGARSWTQCLGECDELTFELDDGRSFSSLQIQGVLNRLVAAPEGIARRAVAEDREYAAAEAAAFYLGWLHGLRGVINTPTPQGLCGSWRHASEWAVLAARAGLEVPIFRQMSGEPPQFGFQSLAPAHATVHSLLVLRGNLYAAPVPGEIGAACRELAALAGTDLLGIDLFESDRGLMFAHATPFPDLTLGGDALIDGLGRAFGAAAAR